MKDIKGYEGLYAATQDGRIWNHRTQRFMSTRIHHALGYQFVNLSKDGTKKAYTVHRLIAKTLLPNPDNLPGVHHRNGIKTDCRVSNLEWTTQEKNMIYSAIYEKVDYLRNLGFIVEIPENFSI